MEWFRFTAIVMLLSACQSYAQTASNSTDSLTPVLDKAQGLIDSINRIAAVVEKVTDPSFGASWGAAIAGGVSAVVVIFGGGFVFGRHMANVYQCCPTRGGLDVPQAIGPGSEPMRE